MTSAKLTLLLALIAPRAMASNYWTGRLPIDGAHLEAAHVAAPYLCATTYNVSKTGSDSNDGSAASPWLTIAHAVEVLNQQGGTHGGVCVNVGPGIYEESVNAGSLSGSADTPTGYFVLRSSELHRAIIEIPRGLADYSDGIRFMNAKYIVIDGFTVVGHISTKDNRDQSGINTFGDKPVPGLCHHLKILNNIVHDVGGSGIAAQRCDYWDVEGNVVYHTSNTSVWGVSAINAYHAVASDDRPGFHIVVRGNISYDNAEVDIDAEHWDGNGITLDDFNGTHEDDKGIQPYRAQCLVENNLCFGNGGAGFMTGGGGANFVTVRNNTCVNNYMDAKNTATLRGEITMFRSRECVLVNNLCVTNPAANPHNRAFIDGAKPGQGNVWRNNLSFNGSPGDPAVNPEDALSFISPTEGNLLGIDPFFVDPKAADFRLLPGSPAIGKGRTSDGMSTVDLAGAARGSVADIGAYTSRGAVRIPR